MRRVTASLGAVIAVLGLLFVGRELVTHRDEALAAISGANLALLAGAFVMASAGMLTVGLGWRRCLRLLGVRRGALDTLRRYYFGQLGKYVPGGVWAVVGRAEMARRGGIPGPVAYAGTMLSLGLTYLAAMLTAALALASGAGAGDGVSWLPVLALLPVGLLVLHPALVGTLLRLVRRVSGRPLDIPIPAWRTSAALLLLHVPAWLGIGTATWVAASALVPGAPQWRNILFATALSWVVGFLAVPVPGGIGVREAVFVAAAWSLPSTGVAAAVAVVARVLFVLADVGGAGVTAVLSARGDLATVRAETSPEDGDALP